LSKFSLHEQPLKRQYFISAFLVLAASLVGLSVNSLVGYRVVAFLLLVTVSLQAMFLDIKPVLGAAILSALIWDYFFIPPRFTLTVGTSDDRILLLMYFIVALINAVLTHRIRKIEKEVKARDEKAKSVKLYNTLINSLSHELRTPITTIIGSADNLQNNSNQLTEQIRTELVSEISLAAIRLNQQVENLLSMSRLDSGILKIKKDWCDINDLIYKTVQRLEANLQGHPLKVNVEDDLPLFKLDFALIEQVLYNLLINITQHTPQGTAIAIDASHINEKLILEVTDNGPGFPKKEIDNVFDKFYRLKGAVTGGTGLGLSIVKGFTEAHHGTVKLRNIDPAGARFTVEIVTETCKPGEA
jgi:two-component system, OmpR family, sensor histidine kinase KdpD